MGEKNNLRETLLSRATAQGKVPMWESPFGGSSSGGVGSAAVTQYAMAAAPKAPTGLPAPMPTAPSRVPPAWSRYLTGLKMQHAYKNSWIPNPFLVRLAGSS